MEEYAIVKELRLENPFKKDQSTDFKSQFEISILLVTNLVWVNAAGSTISELVFRVGQLMINVPMAWLPIIPAIILGSSTFGIRSSSLMFFRFFSLLKTFLQLLRGHCNRRRPNQKLYLYSHMERKGRGHQLQQYAYGRSSWSQSWIKTGIKLKLTIHILFYFYTIWCK